MDGCSFAHGDIYVDAAGSIFYLICSINNLNLYEICKFTFVFSEMGSRVPYVGVQDGRCRSSAQYRVVSGSSFWVVSIGLKDKGDNGVKRDASGPV